MVGSFVGCHRKVCLLTFLAAKQPPFSNVANFVARVHGHRAALNPLFEQDEHVDVLYRQAD